MPGLSQLKKFNADILSLGNEPALRSSRGEKPVTVPIPKNIEDKSDADDFAMGMPEPVEYENISENQDNGPEDFSDIMGTSSDSSAENANAPQINLSVPDLSALSTNGDSEPDLSMFEEPVEETVSEPEPEKEPEKPKEKEVSELSLEDLLGGTGFDGSQGEEEPEPETSKNENNENNETAEKSTLENTKNNDVQDLESVEPLENATENKDTISDVEPITSELETEAPETTEAQSKKPSESEQETSTESNFDVGTENVEDVSSDEIPTENSEKQNANNATSEPFSDLSLDDLVSNVENAPESSDFNATNDTNFDIPDFNEDFLDSENPSETQDNNSSETIVEEPLSVENIPDSNEKSEESSAEKSESSKNAENASFDESSLENPDATEQFKDSSFDDISNLDLDVPDFSSLDNENSEEIKSPEAEETDKEFSFDGNAIDMGEGLPESVSEVKPNKNEEAQSENAQSTENSSSENSSANNVDLNTEDFDLPDGFLDATSDSISDSNLDSSNSVKEESGVSSENNDFENKNETNENLTEKSEENSEEKSDGTDELLSGFNFNLDDFDDDSNSSSDSSTTSDEQQNIEESAPTETFDTSEMEGLDFGIPETDAALKQGDFELGNANDFSDENSDFEIPGFSDVDTVEVGKNGKIKVPTKESESKEEEKDSGEIPPNSLSDEQYKKFIKNLSSYPLNVRMAVEELIVKNEFTDEAEFGIIQKVLKKVSARSLASELEKMLDVAIPVPRDFERRTAEEYEAYKASFQYQLSNKIIPGAILSVAALVVFFFMFQFVRYFVYSPIRANSLYSQGYKLLESENFPQSETKFIEATKFQLIKKWFFRYAEGYKNHKQYIRAEQMYKNILYFFNHDKKAGLDYAEMEYKDLANYENAEQILLREVLDYHINDADGILMLGDNYLEWADEKDSSKYDEALKRYAELVQLYGPTDKYLARMMRYYIRTDNLKEVLNSKEHFYPRPKSLEGQDWTELSGYCLDKLYGYLAPSDEYLRAKIEDVKEMLVRAVKTDGKSPLPYYNIARYYINTNNSLNAERALVQSLEMFDKTNVIKKKDLYKNIDSYRLLGEIYTNDKEYLKALETFTNGITLYTNSKEGSGLKGTSQVGNLYADLGDIEYFISGDYDSALQNYKDAVDIDYDNGKLRYKIGYIQYSKENYSDAIGSFMKAGEDYSDDPNLLLAMGNSLSLRNDNFAAQGYYERLLDQINSYREQHGVLFPQTRSNEAKIVDDYLKASNNLGVTFYRLAQRTGSSAMNAKAMVNFQESLRAWDAVTRNQQTMVRLGGSNLAEQNLKYVTHPVPDFEPAIYTDISKTLSVENGLSQ